MITAITYKINEMIEKALDQAYDDGFKDGKRESDFDHQDAIADLKAQLKHARKPR